MLCHRKIELCPNSPRLPQPLISRETLVDCGRADQLLRQTKERARRLLRQAKQQCEEQRNEASHEFWERANRQLKHWQMERELMCNALEQSASKLTNQALRCVLEEVPSDQRITVLLRQLLEIQSPAPDMTLRCHPLVRNDVMRWISEQENTLWNLQSDDTLDTQGLVLETSEGDFRIDWASSMEVLLLPEN